MITPRKAIVESFNPGQSEPRTSNALFGREISLGRVSMGRHPEPFTYTGNATHSLCCS